MKTRPTVLLLESVSSEAQTFLEEHVQLLTAVAPDKGLDLVQSGTVDAIVTRGKGKVDQELLAACSGLKVVARCGVGLDNIDVSFATQNGIKVINAPGSNAATVAEHTLALMLTAQRDLFQSISEVRKGNWSYRVGYSGDEIRGKKLGIIGMGDIGQRVAHLADVFGMKVSFWNRTDLFSKYAQRSLEEILNESDIISLHLALTAETRDLLKATSFQNNPQKPILINTSRGGVISDSEILKALQKGYLKAFAADVLATEPPDPTAELLRMDNVYITPHAASLTATTYNEMCLLTVKNMVDSLNGKDIDERYIFNRSELG